MPRESRSVFARTQYPHQVVEYIRIRATPASTNKGGHAFPDGERDPERRAVARALDVDCAAVRIDDRLGDRQAEARSRNRADVRLVAAEERIEEPLAIVLGDAAARVGDLEHSVAAAAPGANSDATALRRELDRVRDEVVEHLREPGGIAREGNRVAVLEPDDDAARGLHREQEIADEVDEAVRAALDHGEIGSLFRCQSPGVPVRDQLEVADDRRQRRAQLMRDHCDELVAQADQLLGTRGVVPVDASGTALELEQPDEEDDEEAGAHCRDDESEARRGVDPVDLARLTRELGFDLPVEHRGLSRRREVRDVGRIESPSLARVVGGHVAEGGHDIASFPFEHRGLELLGANGLTLGRRGVMEPERPKPHRGEGEEERCGDEGVGELLHVPPAYADLSHPYTRTMAGRTYKTEAVVLRSIRFGEADRVLHLYTLDRGRVGAVAKGVH